LKFFWQAKVSDGKVVRQLGQAGLGGTRKAILPFNPFPQVCDRQGKFTVNLVKAVSSTVSACGEENAPVASRKQEDNSKFSRFG